MQREGTAEELNRFAKMADDVADADDATGTEQGNQTVEEVASESEESESSSEDEH